MPRQGKPEFGLVSWAFLSLFCSVRSLSRWGTHFYSGVKKSREGIRCPFDIASIPNGGLYERLALVPDPFAHNFPASPQRVVLILGASSKTLTIGSPLARFWSSTQ